MQERGVFGTNVMHGMCFEQEMRSFSARNEKMMCALFFGRLNIYFLELGHKAGGASL